MTEQVLEPAPVIVPSLADELEAKDEEVVSTPASETPEGEKPAATVVPEVPQITDASREMDELRQIIRQQRMQMAALQDQFGKMQTQPVAPASKAADDLDDVFGERKAAVVEPQAPQPTHFEALQQELAYLGATKGPMLDTLIEVMANRPGYEDIKDVCSQTRFSYLVDTAAQAYAQDKNVDMAIATLEIEAAIWRKANPYEWMYKTLKNVHPDFKKVETPAPTPVAPAASAPKPVEAPTSVVPLGGNALEPGATWTAAKIDAMDEEAYAKLPANIKEKYLAGELDAK